MKTYNNPSFVCVVYHFLKYSLAFLKISDLPLLFVGCVREGGGGGGEGRGGEERGEERGSYCISITQHLPLYQGHILYHQRTNDS